MNALAGRIAKLIEAQGPLSIGEFMTIALHDPAAGYYATRDPFGRAGDFVTAPEISQMFGELIGLWMARAWRDQGAPSPARLVELGPGRGTLMADGLRAISRTAPEFLDVLDVVLIESSPALKAVQQQTLKDAGAAISWRGGLDDSLADRPLFLIANEFFDALPIRQYVKTEVGWHERMVTVENGGLAFALAPMAARGLRVPEARGAAEPGAVYEISPAATALTEEIAHVVASRSGAALIVDYGHDGIGFGETLQAVKAHRFADVLAVPGEADLSAHVDFAALAATATRTGAKPYGPVEQGSLLKAIGIEARAEQLARANPSEAEAIAAAVARLTRGDEMGRLFKALALLPAGAPRPAGFEIQ